MPYLIGFWAADLILVGANKTMAGYIYTLLNHYPQNWILLSMKRNHHTWCHVCLQLLFQPIYGFPACLQCPVLPKTTLRGCLHTDAFAPQLQHGQMSKFILGVWPCSWLQAVLAQAGGISSGQCSVTQETHPCLFLESQTLHRTLLSIFCRLHQVLLGPRIKVEGAGLVPLIIGVLNVLQNSGVESCNPNSWEKVQTCILSFQKMPTWISLTEVEQPQGKFSGHIISNSK